LTIITIPIVLHGLGEEAFGIYVLVGVLLSYVGFLDLGLTPAVVRSIAIHYAAGTPEKLSRLLGTAMTLLLTMGVIGGLAIALLAPLAVRSIFHVPAA
jgi:O-antigen/teichoic acid export membrane protein